MKEENPTYVYDHAAYQAVMIKLLERAQKQSRATQRLLYRWLIEFGQEIDAKHYVDGLLIPGQEKALDESVKAFIWLHSRAFTTPLKVAFTYACTGVRYG